MSRRKLNKQQKSRIDGQEILDHWIPGQIIARHGKTLELRTALSQKVRAQIPAKFQGGNQIDDLVVGDRIYYDPKSEMVEAKCERESALVRYRRAVSAPKASSHQDADTIQQARGKIVAANISQLCIVIAPKPFVETLTIDEYLLAAKIQKFEPLIISNKHDLSDAQSNFYTDYLADYVKLGYRLIQVSAQQKNGYEELRQQLLEHTSVFMGTSGVGKSSLLNMLLDEEIAAVGEISHAAALGKHTTTTARLYQLPDGGQLIDAPGIREFKLAIAQPFDLFEAYADLYAGQRCQFSNCTHREEPQCAVKQAVKDGKALHWRYDNYKALFETLVEGKI